MLSINRRRSIYMNFNVVIVKNDKLIIGNNSLLNNIVKTLYQSLA